MVIVPPQMYAHVIQIGLARIVILHSLVMEFHTIAHLSVEDMEPALPTTIVPVWPDTLDLIAIKRVIVLEYLSIMQVFVVDMDHVFQTMFAFVNLDSLGQIAAPH
jgi:hypothetical protein